MALLDASAPAGRVLAVDADAAAIARGRSLVARPGIDGRLRLAQGNFADLAAIAGGEGMTPVDGVLLDLGLSSFQIDDPERGFAFRLDGPLDMRFDPSRGAPAAALIDGLDVEGLAAIIWRYGDERRSRQIAAAIVRERTRAPITTTGRLAEVVVRAVGGRRGADTHPATRTFQALRIAVNDELTSLERALEGAIDVLAPDGRLVVIAFHSLEDRIVKQTIQRESAACICPPEQPVCTCDHMPRLRPLGKPIRSSEIEVTSNPRSRSAIMRVAERLKSATPPARPRV